MKKIDLIFLNVKNKVNKKKSKKSNRITYNDQFESNFLP